MKLFSMQKYTRVNKRESNQIVFGIRAIIEAIESGKEIESLYIQRGIVGNLITELRNLVKKHNIGFQQVPIEKLNRITRKNHQGAIAVISPIIYQKIEDIIPLIYEKGEVPLVLILDGVTDVRNLGAIARTAECAGIHALILPKRGSAEINPDAIKTSAGALFKIPVCREDNLVKVCQYLQDSGLQITASSEKANDSLYRLDFRVPTAIIVGAEDTGISNDILRNADHLMRIPMYGEIASLNVSVSAGVVIYEAIRQRSDSFKIES